MPRFHLPGFAYCLLLFALPASRAELPPTRPSMPGEPVTVAGGLVALTLSDAVAVGLANNGDIRSAYLERAAKKTELKMAEDRFSPKLALNSRHVASQTQDDRFTLTEVSPSATLQGEYGTRFSLAWNNRIAQGGNGGYARDDGASITVVQPLLRGASREVVTAPLRIARLDDQISRLTLKAAVTNTVTQIVISYNEVLRAQEQQRLAREALRVACRRMNDGFHLIAAGFDFDFDFVEIEAEIAVRELAQEDAANQLDAGRLRLLRLLGFDLKTQLRAVDPLEVQQIKVNLAQALVAARSQQPAFLIQLAAAEQAVIRLEVARDQQQWDVSLTGGASQMRSRAAGSDTNRSWENHAGIKIDIPFGDSTRRQAEKRARVDASNQNNRRTEVRLAMERDVGDAVRDLGSRWRQYELAQRAIDLSARKLEAEHERLRAGRSSDAQMFSRESDVRAAYLARLDALIAYRNAQATLDRVQGTTLDSWEISLHD
ncbi:MAG: TolC family protein [Azoarcus sp.]|jgi:outer membrane protein TolC|nr:TolC family protein [Azoarcus sp.]